MLIYSQNQFLFVVFEDTSITTSKFAIFDGSLKDSTSIHQWSNIPNIINKTKLTYGAKIYWINNLDIKTKLNNNLLGFL